MHKYSKEILFLIAFFYSAAATASTEYIVNEFKDDVMIYHCSAKNKSLGVVDNGVFSSAEGVLVTDGCYVHSVSPQGEKLLMFWNSASDVQPLIAWEKKITKSVWGEYRDLLIFFMGLIASFITSIFSKTVEPISFFVKSKLRYIQVRKSVLTKSRRFSSIIELPNEFIEIANGSHMSNIFISGDFRRKHEDMVTLIGEMNEKKVELIGIEETLKKRNL